MSLVNLSPELVLSIASYLRQVDLLNISLVCKHLKVVTEPELNREYSNTRSRPFGPFLKRIISDKRLTRYVKTLNLRSWRTLDTLNPVYTEPAPGFRDEHNKANEFDKFRPEEPLKEEYDMYTAAAKAAGLITDIVPYTAKSRIVERVRPMESDDVGAAREWYDLIFDNETSFNDISYDRRFCHILRAGIEDPLVVLIVAMLPQLSGIFLWDTPNDATALSWQTPVHGFSRLRRLTAGTTDGPLTWPLGFFNPVLAQGKLETLETYGCSSWRRHAGDIANRRTDSVPIALAPVSQNLKKLKLIRSCLLRTDLEMLVEACPRLSDFSYSSGDPETGPPAITPASMVKILERLVNSLEDLCLEIDCSDLPEESEPNVESDFISSLAHFTNLKLLSTPAEMWRGHWADLDAWQEERMLQKEERLCYRLPPGLEVLLFPLSHEHSELPLNQLQDLCHTHSETLPRLSQLWIGAEDRFYISLFESILGEEEENLLTGEGRLYVNLGNVVPKAFDGVSQGSHLPDLKWFGTKYAIRRRKPREFDVVFRRIRERHDDPSLDDREIARLIGQDPEMQAIVQKMKAGDEEQGLYESVDEESRVSLDNYGRDLY